MTDNAKYLIQVQDHIKKYTRVINHITDLDRYTKDFNVIIEHLNKDVTYSVTLTNGCAELSTTETITVPGYIYNSTKTVNKLVYTLSLVKIETDLSELFHTNHTDSETQTTVIDDTSNIQTKETQSEQTTEDKISQTSVEVETEPEIEHTDDEFGEFQSYNQDFVNVDLNTPYYYDNYKSYNPYCNTYNNYSYNPFHNIMSLRGDNEDVHFSFGTNQQGSQVPRTPTQITPPAPTWSPELINELKFRLSQPNAGLLSNNSQYYL